MNKSLRILENPLDVCYLRMPFSDIFHSIREWYKKQNNDEFRNQEKFICYRGCTLNSEELEKIENHINGFIELEGFISTSLDKEVGKKYGMDGNCILYIIVKEENLGGELDNGFANIAEIAYFD